MTVNAKFFEPNSNTNISLMQIVYIYMYNQILYFNSRKSSGQSTNV